MWLHPDFFHGSRKFKLTLRCTQAQGLSGYTFPWFDIWWKHPISIREILFDYLQFKWFTEILHFYTLRLPERTFTRKARNPVRDTARGRKNCSPSPVSFSNWSHLFPVREQEVLLFFFVMPQSFFRECGRVSCILFTAIPIQQVTFQIAI